MSKLIRLLALCGAAVLPALSPARAAESVPAQAARPAIRTLFDVKSRMRDGAQLSSDVWLPEGEGKYPVILIRTPYLKTMPEANFPRIAEIFASQGYAFVVQDVRGRGDSDGEFDFFFQEARDGYDTVESLAAQPWSNGRVCMMGLSYCATVQWLAAKERPPHLTCIAPSSPGARFMDELPYMGGAFGMKWSLDWLNDTSGHLSQTPNTGGVDWDKVFAHRPLLTADEALGRRMRLYREFLQHDTLDAYWKRIRLEKEDFQKIDIPVLTMTGTFDGDQTGALYTWRGMEAWSPGDKADRYLMMGPWTHVQTLLGGTVKQGEVELTQDAIVDSFKVHLDFFDHYLKQSTPKPDWPRVRVYVTGRNLWRAFDQFPPPGQERRLYLGGGGKANTGAGDGALSWTTGSGAADAYAYDPRDPVHVPQRPEGVDRRPIEQRKDVLVYTSAALDKPVEIIGPVSVELYAASDARDTDFTANLVDVYPDGRAVALGPNPVGIVRARYRNGLERQELLKPGAVERYRIGLGDFAHAFMPGHRIRIEVSSSAYPMFNPNQNTGAPVATDTEWRTANQTVFHDRQWPSAVVLPVVGD